MDQATKDDSDFYDGIPEVPILRKKRVSFLPQLILGSVGLVAGPMWVQVSCEQWTIL